MDKCIVMSMRIKSLIDFFANGNNSKFAQLIGTSEANVRNYTKGTSPKFEVLNAIVDEFEISYEWLMKGKGNMFKKEEEESALIISSTSTDWSNCPICVEKDKVIVNQGERIDELKETIAILRAQVNAPVAEDSTKRRTA